MQYIAGFFDGEGNVRLRRTFSKASNHWFIRAEMGIANVYQPILEEIQSQLGGKIRKRQNKHRPIYFLYWSSLDDIKRIVKSLRPYLIIKAPQADLLINYLDRHSSSERSRLTSDDWALVDKMTEYNLKLHYQVNKPITKYQL